MMIFGLAFHRARCQTLHVITLQEQKQNNAGHDGEGHARLQGAATDERGSLRGHPTAGDFIEALDKR